jgi:hypothetical protein
MDPTTLSQQKRRITLHQQHLKHERPTTFKKTKTKPHLKNYWCIPPKQNATFVAKMEDVLTIYSRPYNPKRPVVCMNEKPYLLLSDKHESLPTRPGVTKKVDYQYECKGSCSIFMFCEPLVGWRHAEALSQRRKVEWAHKVKWLLDVECPDVECVVLVLDNLNTHGFGSLYEAFSAEEAFRLAQRLESHFTPVHGSWLNIAEIELSALSGQCLGDRRISDLVLLNVELGVWHSRRNLSQKGVDWQFTTRDARIKLKNVYPIPL